MRHTFGHHHVVRPEDFAVQPVVHCGFTLSPCGFFDRDPALDVPPSRSAHSCCAGEARPSAPALGA